MENRIQVSSLPLKDVIRDLANAFDVSFLEQCEEYYLSLPTNVGKGQIRGINFDNGLGIIIYDCQFNEPVSIEFTVEDIHPVKYLYAVQGPTIHSFANNPEIHELEQNKCAIVASDKNNGHILFFESGKKVHIISLEINREIFINNSSCETDFLSPKLKNLLRDTKANKTFYHEGFYGLDFQQLLNEISTYEGQELIRKFHLESTALKMFVKQLEQFEDDLKSEPSRTILRVNELKKIEDLSQAIKNNLPEKYTVKSLAIQTGLNPNKLQSGFKFIHNTTVNDFIINERLIKACNLMSLKELSIADIANKVGFEGNSYFTKMFKRKYGMTPKHYRKLEFGL